MQNCFSIVYTTVLYPSFWLDFLFYLVLGKLMKNVNFVKSLFAKNFLVVVNWKTKVTQVEVKS